MTTEFVRQEVAATVAADEHKPISGEITLDELAVPYGSGTVELPLNADTALEDLDPRDDVRMTIVTNDTLTGTGRTLDLGIRSRRVDYVRETVSVDVATDEALLQDYAVLAEDTTSAGFVGSLRGLVNNVLARIGATLNTAGSVPDRTFPVFTAAENLLLDPGTTAVTGGGYSAASATLDTADTSWSISYDGTSYNLWNPTAADSYLRIQTQDGTRFPGVQDGKEYVFSATGNVKVGFSGTDLVADAADAGGGTQRSRVRALTVFTRVGSAPYQIYHSQTQLPNTNIPTRLSVKFRVPFGATEVFLRAYLGNTAGQVRWDGFRLSEFDPRPLADNTSFFSGSTPDTADYDYKWTAVPQLSVSTRTPLVDRSPDLLIWKPGVSAWDFLAPILSNVSLRLFCDEARVWRLIDPATYTVPGFIRLSGANAVTAADTISREDAEVFATGVVVRYAWEDSDGNAQIAYDAAGTPEKVVVIDYTRAYPGPGAAAAILARRDGSGRTQDVDALTIWSTTPGNDASITLPEAPEQQGRVSSVRFSLGDDATMSVNTRGLIDIPPGAWLAWTPADQAWTAVSTSVTWNSLPA